MHRRHRHRKLMPQLAQQIHFQASIACSSSAVPLLLTAPGRRRTAWEGNVDVVQVREGPSVHPTNHRAHSTPLPAGEVGRSRSIRSTTRPRGSSGKPTRKFGSSSHNWGAHTWAMAHGTSFLLFSFPFLFFPRRNSSLLFPLCVKHSSSQHNRSALRLRSHLLLAVTVCALSHSTCRRGAPRTSD